MRIDRRAASRELGLALEMLKQDNDLCDKTQQNVVYHVGMAHLLLTTPSARIVRAGHTPHHLPGPPLRVSLRGILKREGFVQSALT